MTKNLIVLLALLLAASAWAGTVATDDLIVEQSSTFNGPIDVNDTISVLAPNGDVSMGTFTNRPIGITGGTITETNGYRIHTFTDSGIFKVSGCSVTCDVLVVAGGGGSHVFYAGGGGAGGVVYTNIITNGLISVVVGAGGNKGYWVDLYTNTATAGSNSSFGSIISIGGDASVCGWGGTGFSSGGGSGAGGPSRADNVCTPGDGTPGQGMNGGAGYGVEAGSQQSGGGGGGYSEVGSASSGDTGGKGGNGLTNTISGAIKVYAGGGGGAGRASDGGVGGDGGGGHGGDWSPAVTPVDGVINTGGGGGGGSYGQDGANGGSGIVIVRYLIP